MGRVDDLVEELKASIKTPECIVLGEWRYEELELILDSENKLCITRYGSRYKTCGYRVYFGEEGVKYANGEVK